MAANIVTTEDLHTFRIQLLDDLKKILSQEKPPTQKQWLKSVEVRKLLKISSATLQNLRVNGSLKFTRIGGTNFYAAEDINQLLEGEIGKNLNSPLPVQEPLRRGRRSLRKNQNLSVDLMSVGG